MGEIILQGISIEDLLRRIDKLISDKLEQVKENPVSAQDEYITRKEVARLLRISLPTLHDWTKAKTLKSYKIGTRVLYKRSEIEQTLTKNLFQKYKRILP